MTACVIPITESADDRHLRDARTIISYLNIFASDESKAKALRFLIEHIHEDPDFRASLQAARNIAGENECGN